MQKQSQDEELSLEDKMHLAVNRYGQLFKSSNWIFIVIILISLVALLEIGDIVFFLENEVDDVDPKILQSGRNGLYIVLAIFVIMLTLLVIDWVWGRKEKKRLAQLTSEFIRKKYILNFEIALPHGPSRIRKFLNQSLLVFPELKEAKEKAKKKGKELEIITDAKIGDYICDLVVNTSEGDFVVEFFKNILTFDKLERFVERVIHIYEKKDIFRLVCVAQEFDKVFYSDELPKKMPSLKRKFKLDLILEDEKGYSMVWID